MNAKTCGPVAIEPGDDVENIHIGVVSALGCQLGPSDAGLIDEMNRAIEASKHRTDIDATKAAVRDMLRFGKYKPTGRGKPASEYLVRAAAEDKFPVINNLVDALNIVSLESLLPISLIDLDGAGTMQFRLRRGREDESYVFNQAGQSIGLRDLLLLARLPADEAVANPVKDSMITKLKDDAKNVVAVIYAPDDDDALHQARDRLTRLFQRFAAPESVTSA